MTDEKQPSTNDSRKRVARPLFVQTFCDAGFRYADQKANDYSERVTDLDGEVTGITSSSGRRSFEEPPDTVLHYRIVTYRSASRIDP